VFIYHNAPMGQGSVSYTGAQLRWDYGVDGVTDADLVEVKVFAIEMVYVPQGSFYLGTGGSEVGAFYTYPDTTQPYQVTSENAITVGTTNGQLYYKPGSDGDYGSVPDSFPKGYHAFYCMKYEITQDQYAAFLNLLDSVQATRFNIRTLNVVRNGITGSPSQTFRATIPYVPADLYLFQLNSYLDWAALRPMTELEYEKACRGTAMPVHNEFAWGTPDILGYNPVSGALSFHLYRLENLGTADELVDSNYSLSEGNAIWSHTHPPTSDSYIVRAGIFAASPSSLGRVTAGATYYGIMEMTGNMADQLVTIGFPEGRTFTGRSGDGRLQANGDTDEPWPQAGINHSQGSGYKGGYYSTDSPFDMMVSDRRTVGDWLLFFSGHAGGGGRGVRTAP
jgi:formylglycine-generating enzyme required for sulfatase activity